MKIFIYFTVFFSLVTPTKKILSQIENSKHEKTINNYIANNEFDKALEYVNTLIEADTNNYLGYYNRGNIYKQIGAYAKSEKAYETAAKDFQHSIKLNPNFTSSYINLGDAYSHYDYLDKAEAEFEKALQIDSTLAVAYNNIGYIKSLYKYHYTAIKYYDKCISYDKKDSKAYINKSISLVELGNINKAIESLDKIISISHNDPNPYFERAGIHKINQDYNLALEDYSFGLNLEPYNSIAKVQRALVKVEMNDYKGAEEDYKSAIAINDNYIWAYYNYGLLLLSRNREEEGLNNLLLSVKYSNNSESMILNVSEVLINSGLKENACELYRIAEKNGSFEALVKLKLNCE